MMKKKLNINWTIVAIILTIIGVGYFISLVHEVNEKDREREYNIHHYSTGKSSSGSYSTGGSSSGTSSYGNSSTSGSSSSGSSTSGAAHQEAVHPITEITTVDLRVNLLMRMTMM